MSGLALFMLTVAACGDAGAPATPDGALPADGADAAPGDAFPADPPDAAPPAVTFLQFGTAQRDDARLVDVDPAGNTFVMGTTRGPIDLGGGVREARANHTQVWIASYGPAGTHRWSHVLASTLPVAVGYSSSVGGICGDGAGGAWIGVIPVGPIALQEAVAELTDQERGVVIAHVDAAGDVTYFATSTRTAAHIGLDMVLAPAPQGGAYVGLSLSGDSLLGDTPITTSGWHLARLDGAGETEWIERLEGYAAGLAALATSDDGLLVALGTMRAQVTVLAQALTVTSESVLDTPFMLRFSPTIPTVASGFAIPICEGCRSDSLNGTGMDVAVTAGGAAVATWNVSGTSGVAWSAARFDAAGAQTWTVPASSGWEPEAVALRGNAVSVVGRTRGLAAVAAHAPDGVAGLLRVDLSAQTGAIEQWSTTPSPVGTDTWRDVAATATGWVTVAGFEGSLELAGETLTGTGPTDALIAWFPQ